MKNFIYNREKDNFLMNDDGERMVFESQDAVYKYLKAECQFTEDWIEKNFYIMKACKIIIHEEIPEIKPAIAPQHEGKQLTAMPVDTDGTIIQFLCGSHSYDGVWFGDKHPFRKGAFWWRQVLQEYFKQQIIEAASEGFYEESCTPIDGEQYYSQTYKL